MWFVSKRKYKAMIEERDNWHKIADSYKEAFEKSEEDYDRIFKEAVEINDLNKVTCDLNERILADLRRVESERDAIREERDHYEERCRYLEGEIEDKEELEAKLRFAIEQRDYYYDLLESTSEVEEKDE